MGKRFLSLLCVLALCLGLLPVTALAAEGAPNSLYVGNQQVISGNDITCWTTSTDGTLTASTDNQSWNVKYDPSTATLTLDGATITGNSDSSSASYGVGIYAQSNSGQPVALTIKLIGENTITGYYGIYVNAEMSDNSYGTDASLTITGENNGSLKVSGSYHGIYVKSGTGDASLNINDASVVASSSFSYSGYAGVYVQSSMHATSSPQLSLKVNGGSLTTSGSEGNDGIQFDMGSSEATGATTSLTVSDNAIVRANGGIKASRVDEPTPSGTGIVFGGTEGTVYGDVTLDESLTINQGETLTVPDGSKLDCNNNLTNNGTILASGGTVTGSLSGGTAVTTPSITTQPTGQTVTEGSTATFSVTASAGDSETLTYQWQQRTDSGSNWSNISDATEASYTISSTTTGMSNYQYRCVVKSASGVGVISNAATLTVQTKPAPVSVTGVTLDKASLSLEVGDTATLIATVEPANATNQNVTWSSSAESVATVEDGKVTAVGTGEATITVTTEDGNKTATCAVTVEEPYTPPPYIPPTKTPSQQAIDKIEDARPGDTVKITLRTGQTKLDKEVFEELAGRDVTLEISLPGGVTWTVNGEDIPKTADLTDLDMGVSLNTSTIPVDLINTITGEIGTVQLTLKHDGPFGFTMTLTAPVGKENKGLWANLYHYDEDAGEMVYQTAALVDEDGNAALPFDHASQYAIVIDDKSHDLPFTDLGENQWFESAVAYAYRHDIMEGMSETAFSPNTSLTRAEAVQVLYNLEGQPEGSEGTTFPDLVYEWYKPAIAWAESTGVVDGYEDGTFRPDEPVNRMEFAQMLYNYAAYKGYDLTAQGDLSQFPDGSEVQEWALPAMTWANGNELINGHDDGTLEPGGTTTRAQAASILMRFDQNMVEE